MNKKVELLAPAGDWDSFMAAVENGADAIYLGGKLFNARQFAGNFDDEQLKKAIDYAHVRDVNVYLTMNTLMSDNELGQALDFVGGAYLKGVDGVIVQDIGLAGILAQGLPDLPLHASTQMTIYNIDGVRILEKLGFKRAVLARELSLDEISYIAGNTSLEIEVFVHGALCISYSGQCLMSSIIGGRSGNRGKCAQPCRLPYELVNEKTKPGNEAKNRADIKVRNTAMSGGQGMGPKYLLSPKDLCSIDQLERITDCGVRSLKIEGRMKSPEYVATVVRIYRKYLDRALDSTGSAKNQGCSVDEDDLKALAQVFNRGGFSQGYLNGKTGSDMMCYEKPKNWGLYLGEVIAYDRDRKLLKVRLEENISIGDGIEVWNGENESPGTVATEIKVNGVNRGAAEKGETAVIGSIKGRISKGNRIYKTSDKKMNTAAKESYTGKNLRKTSLFGEVELESGKPLILTVKDNRGNKVSISGEKSTEEAVNRPLTEERIREQIAKTGMLPFKFEDIQVNLEANLSIPISEINEVRRKALEELENKRADIYRRTLPEQVENAKKRLHFPGNSRKLSSTLKLSVFFYRYIKEFDWNTVGAGRIYMPFMQLLNSGGKELAEILHSKNCELFAWLPSVTRGNYDRLIEGGMEKLISSGVDGILAGNPGTIELVKKLSDIRIMGDYSLNVFNSKAMEEFRDMHLMGVTLSPELNLGQINNLIDFSGFEKEVLAYGRLPLMTSEYCPVGSIAGGFGRGSKCNLACTSAVYKLKDRMGMEFPIMCDKTDCRSTIFNSNPIFAADSLDKIRKSGVDTIRVNITDEEPREIAEVLELHRDIIENGIQVMKNHTGLVERIKGKGFTKGHFFRGV